MVFAPGDDADHVPSRAVLAAQYVRMSTDQQRYSIQNQAAAIQRYADEHGLDITRSYEDHGQSGLTLAGRKSLRQLLADVLSGSPGFEVLLVYDVSRWGRFQDPDESAHYEYVCRQAGVRVEYCAEPFENNGTPLSTIVKSVKRAMAGEFSRELSVKVFAGQERLMRLGFAVGGRPGFGLSRHLVDDTGRSKGILDHGERKSLISDHVRIVPGPSHEVAAVRKMFDLFVKAGMSSKQIADRLNAEGCRSSGGLPWSRTAVTRMLQDEKYIGNHVWNRTRYKLRAPRRQNPATEWIRIPNAFPAIVNPALFHEAQALFARRTYRRRDPDLIEALKGLHKRVGPLTGRKIQHEPTTPSLQAYRDRFGDLATAYKLAGYTPPRDYSFLEAKRRRRALLSDLTLQVAEGFRAAGAVVVLGDDERLTINTGFTVGLCVARRMANHWGGGLWQFNFGASRSCDLTLAVGMDTANTVVERVYAFPAFDHPATPLEVASNELPDLALYRIADLATLYEMGTRIRIGRANGAQA